MMNREAMELLRLIRNRSGIIVLFGLIFALISFYAFIFTQKRYETKTDFLIVQDQMGTQDFYSLSKSAEYLGGVLSESVYSSVFIDELKKTGKVDTSYFPVNERDLMKKWKKAVEIERSPNLGILKIRVYDNSKNVAIGISQGISDIMVTKNYLFRGKVNLDVRVLSGPLTEKNPSIGKILLVITAGFLIGVMIKIMHLYYSFINILARRAQQEEYRNNSREIR